jgi:hypothetical protein
MKKFILGIFIGILLIVLFTYLGGGTALKIVGQKTIQVGERVEVYEKALKDITQGLMKERHTANEAEKKKEAAKQ